MDGAQSKVLRPDPATYMSAANCNLAMLDDTAGIDLNPGANSVAIGARLL